MWGQRFQQRSIEEIAKTEGRLPPNDRPPTSRYLAIGAIVLAAAIVLVVLGTSGSDDPSGSVPTSTPAAFATAGPNA
jgi:hypothetical protein